MLNHDWQGQSNLLVLALTAWALEAELRDDRSERATGLLLAPAILLKLFPGIFLLYLVVRRRWTALAWTAAAGALITALTLVWIPISDYLRFPDVLFGSMYLKDEHNVVGNYSMAAAATWIGAALGLGAAAVKVFGAALKYLPLPLALGASALEARREASLVGERAPRHRAAAQPAVHPDGLSHLEVVGPPPRLLARPLSSSRSAPPSSRGSGPASPPCSS